MPNLMWLFVVPFIAALILFLCAYCSARNIKALAVTLSLIPLAIVLYNTSHWIGSEVRYDWLPALSISFHLSIDSLSLVFLYLTAIIVPISLAAVDEEHVPLANMFYGLILFLEGLLIGFFTTRDLALFTVFWEAMLLPLYFVISLWGGSKRKHAALQFLIYMIAGSALLVAAVLALYFTSGQSTFDMDVLAKTSYLTPYAPWICGVFLLAFAVKTPLFPFHAWLPDAYTQAPIAGTILLSAILSKAGIYGFLRVGMEQFPQLMQSFGPLLMGFAIAGVFYGGFSAWGQRDYKRLVAYSSLSHVNFILAGVFIWDQAAHTGAVLQSVNHAVTIAGLFLVAKWLEDRIGTTEIAKGGGLAKYLPQLCWLTFIFVLASVALPSTNNFVGELLIFFGLFGKNPMLTALLGLSIILSAIYMLRFMQKLYFGHPHQDNHFSNDIHWKEFALALPLIVLIFWVGIYPKPLLHQAATAAEKISSYATPQVPQ